MLSVGLEQHELQVGSDADMHVLRLRVFGFSFRLGPVETMNCHRGDITVAHNHGEGRR